MHTLEPLCNAEQSVLLKELKFEEEVINAFAWEGEDIGWIEEKCAIYANYNRENYTISRPTISMARNWVFREYGIWMETTYMPETQSYYARIWTELPLPFTGINDSPIIAESECLTEILKHLKATSCQNK